MIIYNNVLLPGLFTYCGGKKRVLKELDGFFDTHHTDTFIDLCGGSGIVTANCIASRRIINDITTELTTIYKALSCDKYAYPLADILQSLECNEETFEKAKAYLKEHSSYRLDDYTDDELPTAAAYSWFVHYFSRVGNDTKSKPTFSENKLRKWYNLVDGKICEYMDAFEGVEVWNMDVCNALKRVENEIKEECTIYIDPPYLSAVNSNVKTDMGTYDHNSSNSKQEFCISFSKNNEVQNLFERFMKMHRNIMYRSNALPAEQYHIFISNYDNELYNSILETNEFKNWDKAFVKEIDLMCGNGSNCTAGRALAKEFLYMNFKS